MIEQLFYVFLCFAYPFAFIVGVAGAVLFVFWLFDKLICRGE